MGITFNNETNAFEVLVSQRHPITRKPMTLKRRRNDKGELIRSNAEAQRLSNSMRVKINEAFRMEVSKTVMYRDLLELFNVHLDASEFSKKTVENHRLCLNAHTLKIWGDRNIESIRPDEIRQLIRVNLADRSMSQQKNVLKYLRKLFLFAVDEGHLVKSPVPMMQFRLGDKIKKVLTESQLRIFLNKAKEYEHEWYPIWVAAVYTGMRNGELYALTWDKVDFENQKILVSSTWNSKDGFKDLTKSGVDRNVGIAPPLLSLLRELRLKSEDTSFVLPKPSGWAEGRQAELLRYFLTGLTLPPVRFHDLRASWATVMLGKGIEPIKVMSMGGWKDMKTMMIYVRKAGIDIRGITDNLVLHNPSRDDATVINLKKEPVVIGS